MPFLAPPFGALERKRYIMTTSQSKTARHTRRTTDAPSRDPMQEFANRIIAELENGVKPWGETRG